MYIMDISTAFKHIKNNTPAKLSIKTKLEKLLDSHSIKDKTQDINVLYDVFRQNEEEFIKTNAMPSDWKSKRVYSAGFQAMRMTVDIEPIKKHLVSKIGDEALNSLKQRLHFYEKKFDKEYKHENANRKNNTPENTVLETSVDNVDDLENETSISQYSTKAYEPLEYENIMLKKQLNIALKVILDLHEMENDVKVKRLVYSMYEAILSIH